MEEGVSVEGRDVVCFTAGITGSSFAAGVIHAHLAADRKPPVIVAGVSMGAVNAAAMRRCYEELGAAKNEAEREVARWAWYRKYLRALTRRPFQPIWDSIPDLEDFFANRPPIWDRSTPKSLERSEAEKVRRRFLMTRLGRWLGRSPVSIADVARFVVARVRFLENYDTSRFNRWVKYRWFGLRLLVLVVWHVIRHPTFISEARLNRYVRGRTGRSGWRPLFGWRAYALVIAAVAITLSPLLVLVLYLPSWPGWAVVAKPLLIALGMAVACAATIAVFVTHRTFAETRRHCRRLLLELVGIEDGIAPDFHVRRRLVELFGDKGTVDLDGPDDLASTGEVPRLLIGTTPLWGTKVGELDWVRHGTRIDQALRIAIAIPPVLSPERDNRKPSVPLIDGHAIRQNPLPILFTYLRKHPALIRQLALDGDASRATVHVVLNSPVDKKERETSMGEDEVNLVDVAFAGLRLARRRDTLLEVRQTEIISDTERLIWKYGGMPATEDLRVAPLVPDLIAPEQDLTSTRNPLAPKEDTLLANVASGCRRTLERLYAAELAATPSATVVTDAGKTQASCTPCALFLSQLARARKLNDTERPGLPEVCSQCTGVLQSPLRQDLGDHTLIRQPERFPQLSEASPRIVLAMSGGVFRGAFHIGFAAGLLAARARPDLVVGASVGSLLGAAIASMFQVDEPSNGQPREDLRRLAQLVDVFVRVDETVALTRSFKTASRDLGLRAQRIEVTPRVIRKLIRRGARSDPGFAATGAPPVLIDALADLFLIQRRRTAEIAAQFTSGHITDAMTAFWAEIKRDGLRRLNIEQALIDTTLLGSRVEALLGLRGEQRRLVQPYQVHKDKPIAFFATATDLASERDVLFGADPDDISFDFVESILASSAFPGVFAPRRKTDVYPGDRTVEVRYSDGGVFDNLPIVRALRILSDTQRKSTTPEECVEELGRRYDNPDLFIVGALNANPTDGRYGHYWDALDVSRRATELGHNIKIRTLINSTKLLSGQSKRLRAVLRPEALDPVDVRKVNRIVQAAILPVYPLGSEYLNGTFAFCRSLALDPKRVRRSIAHGCFQTMRTLATACTEGNTLLGRSVRGLQSCGKLPRIGIAPSSQHIQAGECPYFTVSHNGHMKALSCPFLFTGGSSESSEDWGARQNAARVHHACLKEAAHREALEVLRRPTSQSPAPGHPDFPPA